MSRKFLRTLDGSRASGYMWSRVFLSKSKGEIVQMQSPKRLYRVEVEFHNGLTRSVPIKAVSREKAEQRALKLHPSAKGIKRGAV